MLAVLGLVLPVGAQDGPWYDVSCPTDSAEVVLDPGHGGADPGAVQETYGLFERILTLEVTERVVDLLEEDGYTVALTRADGVTELANSERGEIATACGASVFVEIHLNASLDTTMDFAQTFWAEKEKDLAFSLVMNEALGATGIPVRAVERFDNGGLLRAKMPSVLVETVFLSNGKEAMDLANGTRQEGIARAIAGGIDRWLTLAGDAPEPVVATPTASPVIASPSASPVVPGSGSTPVAYAPDAEIGGADQSEWMARRWQWLLELPIGANPGHDVSGASCAVGQEGPVFFVPGNLPPCTVPVGTSVLVPVAGSFCTTVDPDAATGPDDLRDCAMTDADRYTARRVFVDGVEVPDVERHRYTTAPFDVALPERNILGGPEGTATVVASGWQVILPPLPPGEHEVIVHVELVDGTVLPDKRMILTITGS